MRRLVIDGRKNGLIRQTAAGLVNGLRQKDYLGEIKIIHAFVRDNIRYVRDVRNVETLHAAPFILQQGYGDCDDKTVLTCAMLESIGHKTRMTIVALYTPAFCHVFPEVLYNGKWIPLEVTEPVNIGWLPENITKRYSLEI